MKDLQAKIHSHAVTEISKCVCILPDKYIPKHYVVCIYVCLVSECQCDSTFGSFVGDTECREECLLCLGELKGEEDML